MKSHENDLRSVVSSDEECRLLQTNYRQASITEREQAILDYAVKLTKTPTAIGRADLELMRQQGMSDVELVDAVHCIGYFNFINRVLDGLGVELEPAMKVAS